MRALDAASRGERRLMRWPFSVALVLCGCSLLVDASDIDVGCPEGYKFCRGCVSIDDPRYGCDDVACTRCGFPNAEPKCEDGQCKIKRCLYGFGDPLDGACANPVIGDPENCGAPSNACNPGELCIAGACLPPDAQ